MANKWERYGVPSHTMGALARYFLHGLEPGSFTLCVLQNDLVGAAARADHINSAVLNNIALYVRDVLPTACWRETDNVYKWMDDSRYRAEVISARPDLLNEFEPALNL